jgi:hypothetical protein
LTAASNHSRGFDQLPSVTIEKYILASIALRVSLQERRDSSIFEFNVPNSSMPVMHVKLSPSGEVHLSCVEAANKVSGRIPEPHAIGQYKARFGFVGPSIKHPASSARFSKRPTCSSASARFQRAASCDIPGGAFLKPGW